MKTTVDWQAVEREYRAALLSNRELADKHGCSEAAVRKRAKAGGWQKDLSAMIRKRVANKVAQAPARRKRNDPPPQQDEKRAERQEAVDEQIVEDASSAIAEIISEHHEVLSKTRERVERVFGGLDKLLDEMEKAKDEEDRQSMLARSAKLLELHTRTLERILKLERVSYGLDESDEAAGKRRTLSDLLKAVMDDES